jgi:hypothetical protein
MARRKHSCRTREHPSVIRNRARRRWGSRRFDRDASAVVLPPAGQAIFELYRRLLVGDNRSSLALLQIWGYKIEPPWQAVGNSISDIASHGDWVEALNLVCLLGAASLTVFGARRLPVAYTLYVAPSLLFLFCREMWLSPLMSAARYSLILFPCFLCLAMLLRRAQRLVPLYLGVSFGLQVVFFVWWVHWKFIG